MPVAMNLPQKKRVDMEVKGRMTTPTTEAGAVVISGTLLAELETALDTIFARKRERSTTGGQQVGLEVWRTEFTGMEYGDVLDKLNALRDSIVVNSAICSKMREYICDHVHAFIDSDEIDKLMSYEEWCELDAPHNPICVNADAGKGEG